MSIAQNSVGWGITATSLESRCGANQSARFKPKYSDTATRALAGAGGGGNQDDVDALVNSLAKVTVRDSKASEDGTEQKITGIHSDRVPSKKQASDGDDKNKVANKEPALNFERTLSNSLQAVQKRYEQPTPKAATPVLPRATKQGDDVDSLVSVFDWVKVEDKSNSEDAIQRKHAEEREAQWSPKIITNDLWQVKSEGSDDWSAPSSPWNKGEGDRLYFRSENSWCYFDEFQNVYFEDGTLLHDASFTMTSDQFSIDQLSYCFYDNWLLSQATDGSFYQVQTRHQKYYFHTPSGLYYFDYRWNVFSNEGELLYASPSTINPGGLLPATCRIGETVYWFDMDELWCQAPDNKCYRVHTWQSDPNESLANRKHRFYACNSFYYLDECRNLYSEDGKLVCRGPSSFVTDELGIPSFRIGGAPFWQHKDGLLSRGTDDMLYRVLAWPKDSCASDAKSDPLQAGLLARVIPWSPTSSPSSSPPDSNQTRSTAPLLPKLSSTQSAPMGPAQDIDPEEAQAPPERKRGNKDHLKCPYCDKVCRRPIALKEHIRAHEKEKSHVCPFVDPNTRIACDTGFCTKQNMRRHFSIHRAGALEEYLGLPSLPPRKKRENATLGFDAHNPYYTREKCPLVKDQ